MPVLILKELDIKKIRDALLDRDCVLCSLRQLSSCEGL